MTGGSNSEIVETLPPQPVSAEAVKEIGDSSAVTGTMPIESNFNNLVTEFLIFSEGTMHALVFDPEAETWCILESREYDRDNAREVENQLIGRLYEWREEHVLPFLIENDLIPAFKI